MKIWKRWIFSIGKNNQYWAGLRVGNLDFEVRPLITPTGFDTHQRDAALVEKEMRRIFDDVAASFPEEGDEDLMLAEAKAKCLAKLGNRSYIRPYPPDWKRPRIGTYSFTIETVFTEGEDEGMGNTRFVFHFTLGRLR